jgi:undecaprenyl-diphosphatase
MAFLRMLEGIRVPILNEFMLGITYFGDEIAFLVVALVLFWCIDKRKAYFVLTVGFLGTISNQFMKLCFRVPRPWVQDPDFTILEQAREAASGYSCPSGHTQSAVGTFGSIAYTTKNKLIRTISIIIAVLVPFSRMYIGVHTPADVIVSVAIAVTLIFVLRPIVLGKNRFGFPVLLSVMALLATAFMCYVEFYPFPDNIDTHNLASGIKNAYTLLGSLLGLCVVYIVDEKWLNFPVKAVWWSQLLKVVFGLALVLLVKSGLKTPLNVIFGESIGRAVRYSMIVVVAGIVWPLTFRYFLKLGSKEQ